MVMRNLAKWILPIGLLLFALGARGQVVISEVMAKNETVLTAAEELQRWIGRKTELCCYPFGHRTPDTDAALDKAGFLPVTLLPGMIAKGQTALRRNLLKDRFSLRENIGRILGAWVAVHVADND